MASDDQVMEFIAFTGAGPEDARGYLEMAGGNLQQAVGLFMEMGGGGGGGGAAGGGGGGPATADGAAPEEEEVRAPIAAFDDQIIDADADKKRMEKAIAADATAMQQRMSFDREKQVGGDWKCPQCG